MYKQLNLSFLSAGDELSCQLWNKQGQSFHMAGRRQTLLDAEVSKEHVGWPALYTKYLMILTYCLASSHVALYAAEFRVHFYLFYTHRYIKCVKLSTKHNTTHDTNVYFQSCSRYNAHISAYFHRCSGSISFLNFSANLCQTTLKMMYDCCIYLKSRVSTYTHWKNH